MAAPLARQPIAHSVTIRDLLTHSSGLTAYLPFYRDYTGRAEFEHAICSLPLEYAPRLAVDLQRSRLHAAGVHPRRRRARGPAAAGAPGAFDPVVQRSPSSSIDLASFLTAEPLTFNPPRSWRSRCAPTEVDRWRGRLLIGEVHDENCWALGGAAGHAGLFGTAAAVGAFARAVLRTIAGEPIAGEAGDDARVHQRGDRPGSSRALGWDTMLPTSSCGTLMSPTAIGHTGFTGTSLWIDWERDLYVVLLTNRVHPTRQNKAIRSIRPRHPRRGGRSICDLRRMPKVPKMPKLPKFKAPLAHISRRLQWHSICCRS